jgi:hypothetical protein
LPGFVRGFVGQGIIWPAKKLVSFNSLGQYYRHKESLHPAVDFGLRVHAGISSNVDGKAILSSKLIEGTVIKELSNSSYKIKL